MSSMPASEIRQQPVLEVVEKVRPTPAEVLGLFDPAPELYPSLFQTLKAKWDNRKARWSLSVDGTEWGRETGARV